jgi:hypothetical protein
MIKLTFFFISVLSIFLCYTTQAKQSPFTVGSLILHKGSSAKNFLHSNFLPYIWRVNSIDESNFAEIEKIDEHKGGLLSITEMNIDEDTWAHEVQDQNYYHGQQIKHKGDMYDNYNFFIEYIFSNGVIFVRNENKNLIGERRYLLAHLQHPFTVENMAFKLNSFGRYKIGSVVDCEGQTIILEKFYSDGIGIGLNKYGVHESCDLKENIGLLVNENDRENHKFKIGDIASDFHGFYFS